MPKKKKTSAESSITQPNMGIVIKGAAPEDDKRYSIVLYTPGSNRFCTKHEAIELDVHCDISAHKHPGIPSEFQKIIIEPWV